MSQGGLGKPDSFIRSISSDECDGFSALRKKHPTQLSSMIFERVMRPQRNAKLRPRIDIFYGPNLDNRFHTIPFLYLACEPAKVSHEDGSIVPQIGNLADLRAAEHDRFGRRLPAAQAFVENPIGIAGERCACNPSRQ